MVWVGMMELWVIVALMSLLGLLMACSFAFREMHMRNKSRKDAFQVWTVGNTYFFTEKEAKACAEVNSNGVYFRATLDFLEKRKAEDA